MPWNLNLGGSSNELRISPISEMDLSYNYFVAELVTPQAYRGKYNQKASIRFDIESIEIGKKGDFDHIRFYVVLSNHNNS